MDWQPIETAPKDGSMVLGWDGFGQVIMSWWQPEPIEIEEGATPCWVASSMQEDQFLDPTDWQPLPAPPVQPSN